MLVKVEKQLKYWDKLSLSWYMGTFAAVKMKMLPKFIFLFQNLIQIITTKTLHYIQMLINMFIWGGGGRERPRIKKNKMHQKLDNGGVALPNLILYDYSAMLLYLLQWWNMKKSKV